MRTRLWRSECTRSALSVAIFKYDRFVLRRYAREKLKARRVKPTAAETKDKEEEQASYAPFEDPDTEARSLGQWQAVPTASAAAEQPYIDLQLPVVPNDYVYVPAANVEPERPAKIFKEKVVTSLAADGASASGGANEFKKRKGVAAKRNMRQRLDDD